MGAARRRALAAAAGEDILREARRVQAEARNAGEPDLTHEEAVAVVFEGLRQEALSATAAATPDETREETAD